MGVMTTPRRPERVAVRLSADEAARLDELRGELGRAAYLRALLDAADPLDVEPTRDEALALLTTSARQSSIPARVALARLMDAVEPRAKPKPAQPFMPGQSGDIFDEIDDLAARRRRATGD